MNTDYEKLRLKKALEISIFSGGKAEDLLKQADAVIALELELQWRRDNLKI